MNGLVCRDLTGGSCHSMFHTGRTCCFPGVREHGNASNVVSDMVSEGIVP